MAFVKLDCGILNSTLWVEREPRDIFITALLMAAPCELTEPMDQFMVSSLEKTGFTVPPGWYGFVQAAGPGIVRMAMADPVLGMRALSRLGEPDPESRSSDFDGRRLVRVDGGFVVLNYMKYRDKDNTAAVRAQRYRDRKKQTIKNDASHRDATRVTRDSSCGVTIAEADREEEEYPPTPLKSSSNVTALNANFDAFNAFWAAYPRKVGKPSASKAFARIKPDEATLQSMLKAISIQRRSAGWTKDKGEFIPHPATWLNDRRWEGDAAPADDIFAGNI